MEALVGPFRIATTDLRVILKITGWYETDTVDGQFILIDCEGDVIHHNGQDIGTINGYPLALSLERISL